jgi:hypothetical protein
VFTIAHDRQVDVHAASQQMPSTQLFAAQALSFAHG